MAAQSRHLAFEMAAWACPGSGDRPAEPFGPVSALPGRSRWPLRAASALKKAASAYLQIAACQPAQWACQAATYTCQPATRAHFRLPAMKSESFEAMAKVRNKAHVTKHPQRGHNFKVAASCVPRHSVHGYAQVHASILYISILIGVRAPGRLVGETTPPWLPLGSG